MKGADSAILGRSNLEVSSTPPPPAPLAEGVTYRPPIINMKYFGGPVLWKPIHLYFVWYGNWTEAEKKVVRATSNSLTPKKKIRQYPNLSNLWSTVTKYYQEPQSPGEKRKYATKSVSIEKEINDDYSFGKNIDADNDPLKIILSHLGQDLPTDLEQGIYFLFTSGDVTFPVGGYCGYHDNLCVDPTREGTPFCDDYAHNSIIYSFVPMIPVDNGLINGCNVFETSPGSGGLRGLPPNHTVSVTNGPNGGLDSVITVYLHELLETAVDPIYFLKPAWRFDSTDINTETEDFCEFSYTAGDWYYCGKQIAYPDFPGVNDGRCLSIYDNHAALVEPKFRTTFNMYGIDGSKFIVQQMWSLANQGCTLQPEEACPRRTVEMCKAKGTIQRGLFFKGTGLQRYAPGQNCSWKIQVRNAKSISLYFEKVALEYDDLDFVTVAHDNVVKKKVTGFGENIKVKVSGDKATTRFVTYSGRSPYPSSAGFIMHYEADLY